MGATEFNSSAYINTNIVKHNNKAFNISLFPNPATNSFNILLNANEELEYIEIFDIAGRSIEIIYTKELKVDVSSLKSGMYLINLKTNKYSYSKKLMVK